LFQIELTAREKEKEKKRTQLKFKILSSQMVRKTQIPTCDSESCKNHSSGRNAWAERILG
jgi:hypothetical protein